MSKCLICSSENVENLQSGVSDFLKQRMFEGKNIQTNAVHCKNCHFTYYNLRPSNEEIKRLYNNYRGISYQKERQQFESWYTPEINEMIGNGIVEIESRRKNLEAIFVKYINIDNISTVLDYGGDRGQHIPPVLNNKRRYVYEISGVKPIPGVYSLTNLSNKKNYFDIVLCCNVLEHVINPADILTDIKNVIKNKGYLYLELPYDNPLFNSKLDFFHFLFNKYFSWKDIAKQVIKMLKTKGFKPMHEHINFFSPESLEILLKNNNFEILYNKITKLNFGWTKSKIICTLARLK